MLVVSLLAKIKERSRLIMTLCCIFVAMVVLSYKLMKQRESGVESDYHDAHLFFEKWKGGEEEMFEDLSRLLNKRPALRTAFTAHIAQHLINNKKVKEAKAYLLKNSRGGSQHSYHEQFATTSILIADGELILALSQAKALRDALEKKGDQKPKLLNAFNLLRITQLEKEVGTKKGELEAWMALEALDAVILSSIQEVFHVNDVTIFDYLKHRKAALAN